MTDVEEFITDWVRCAGAGDDVEENITHLSQYLKTVMQAAGTPIPDDNIVLFRGVCGDCYELTRGVWWTTEPARAAHFALANLWGATEPMIWRIVLLESDKQRIFFRNGRDYVLDMRTAWDIPRERFHDLDADLDAAFQTYQREHPFDPETYGIAPKD